MPYSSNCRIDQELTSWPFKTSIFLAVNVIEKSAHLLRRLTEETRSNKSYNRRLPFICTKHKQRSFLDSSHFLPCTLTARISFPLLDITPRNSLANNNPLYESSLLGNSKPLIRGKRHRHSSQPLLEKRKISHGRAVRTSR